jgi:hypothetical protein
MRGRYERIGGRVTPAETWEEYRNLVLSEMERFDHRANAIERKLHTIGEEMVSLKTKMAMTAAGVGIALTIVQVVLKFWRP